MGLGVAFPFRDGAVHLSPVARYQPNPWGFHDLLGNVREWCSDAAPGSGPAGQEPAARHVVCGGSWASDVVRSRCTDRSSEAGDYRNDRTGFRPAFDDPWGR